MSIFSKALESREVGKEIPASLGTAHALESFLNLGEFHQPGAKAAYYQADELWVSARTLFRNAYNSLDSSAQKTIPAEALVDLLTEDLGIIESSLDQATKGRVGLRLYFCSFSDLDKHFPHARIKSPSTDLQKLQRELEEKALEGFFHTEPQISLDFHKTRIEKTGERVFILTHLPVDLLWRKQFRKLVLLESHTGKQKAQPQWHTKLTGGSKLPRMPFNRLTLQVFGDGNHLFRAFSVKYKRALNEAAERYQWTPLTTLEKVRFSIERIEDKQIAADLKALL